MLAAIKSVTPDRRGVMVDLSMMLPLALRWAEKLKERVVLEGEPLNATGISMARSVGVKRPELIRLLEVDHIPMPAGPMLREMTSEIGVLSHRTIGIAVGHSILLKKGRMYERLLLHEFRHVYQFEEAGSLESYLEKYLQQVVAFGYRNAPLEVDARKHEVEQ